MRSSAPGFACSASCPAVLGALVLGLTSTRAHAAPGADARGTVAGTAASEDAAPSQAAADQRLDELASLSLEELLDVSVVTVTKTERKVGEAPAIVSVLTRRDLERWGYQSLAEALRHVVGFYIVDDHILPNAGVRGVAGGLFGESSTIKVMIDGQSVAFRSTGGNWLGPELVPLSAVERIEIIRGPSSALYGADAFLAVVNVITRQGEDLSGGTLRGSAEFSDGRDLGTDLDLATGARKGPVDTLVAVRVHREDRSGLELPSTSPAPEVPEYRSGDLSSRGADHASTAALMKVAYHFDERNRLSLVAHHSTFERGAEFSPWIQLSRGLDGEGRFHDTRIALRQSTVGLIQESTLPGGAVLTLRGHYFNGGLLPNDRIDVGSEIFSVERDFGYEGLEGSAEGRFDVLEGLSAVVGAELLVDRENLPSSLQVAKVGTDGFSPGELVEESSTRQADTDISNVAAYVQGLWTALEPLFSAVAGARYDHHGIYAGQLSARAGAVSSPTENVHLKVLYGSAFKAPSPLLLYGVPLKVGDIIGNPDLEPQRVHTVEGQVAVEPAAGLVVSTGLSYSRLLNKAELVTRGVNRAAQNLSEVDTLSWESELSLNHDHWFHGYASFELPHTVRNLGQQGFQAELVGDENVIYPGYVLRLGASAVLGELPLRATAETIHVGPRRASEMNILERGAPYSLDPYLTLDASVSTVGVEMLDGRETVVTIKGRNLLDEAGPDPGFVGVDYPLLPLSVTVQLRQEL